MIKRTTETHVKSWEQFEAEIVDLDDPNRTAWHEIWFRGQADAHWALNTTLERRVGAIYSVKTYLRLINRIKPMVETFTGAEFQMPTYAELEKGCTTYDLFHSFLDKYVTYMAHLRHNGFPSPLLDWTKSAYVAAYFAFAHVTDATDVAVYVLDERPKRMKVQGSNLPHILSFGPHIKTHRRHFRQQSRYTVCVKFENDEWMFVPHEHVFGSEDNREQDLLRKITIPAKERPKVLRHFDKFNLNAFTLFDSEEGLLEMLAMREFDLRPGLDAPKIARPHRGRRKERDGQR